MHKLISICPFHNSSLIGLGSDGKLWLIELSPVGPCWSEIEDNPYDKPKPCAEENGIKSRVQETLGNINDGMDDLDHKLEQQEDLISTLKRKNRVLVETLDHIFKKNEELMVPNPKEIKKQYLLHLRNFLGLKNRFLRIEETRAIDFAVSYIKTALGSNSEGGRKNDKDR